MRGPPKPGHRALRKGRVSLANHAYFLTVVTRHRQRHFIDFNLACAVARELDRPCGWTGARALAWVLMPDHCHVLLTLPEGQSLGQVMQSINSRTARAANSARGGCGAIWQPAYHDRAVRSGEGLREAARYLVANPVRAGLVTRVGDYPFWNCIWIRGPNEEVDLLS
jgi:REP element-mobilizing transposase RayT